jgi:hypothetical protein
MTDSEFAVVAANRCRVEGSSRLQIWLARWDQPSRNSSDLAARVVLKELRLEPDKDVAILQVGSSTERAAAFRTGRIAGFPSRHDSPGSRNAAPGFDQHGKFSENFHSRMCARQRQSPI